MASFSKPGKSWRAEVLKLGVRKSGTFDTKAEVKVLVGTYHFTAAELGLSRKARTAVKAKYVNPDNPTQTWGGKGKRPAWFDEKVAAGVPKDAMLAK